MNAGYFNFSAVTVLGRFLDSSVVCLCVGVVLCLAVGVYPLLLFIILCILVGVFLDVFGVIGNLNCFVPFGVHRFAGVLFEWRDDLGIEAFVEDNGNGVLMFSMFCFENVGEFLLNFIGTASGSSSGTSIVSLFDFANTLPCKRLSDFFKLFMFFLSI